MHRNAQTSLGFNITNHGLSISSAGKSDSAG